MSASSFRSVRARRERALALAYLSGAALASLGWLAVLLAARALP